jgi:hypothetical protein
VIAAAAVVAVQPLLRLSNDAAPDSAAVALEQVARALDGWHEFYLLAGTGAVTLVGLLFVALSFHLDAILDDSRSHLLAAARMAFMNFLYVLLLSLFFLMPGMPPHMHGFAVLVLSAMCLAYIAWNGLRTRRPAKLSEHEKFLGRRFMIAGFLLGIGIVAAINFMLEPRRLPLIQFAALTCGVLANATGMSWDLLVQVGRIRKSFGEAPKA